MNKYRFRYWLAGAEEQATTIAAESMGAAWRNFLCIFRDGDAPQRVIIERM